MGHVPQYSDFSAAVTEGHPRDWLGQAGARGAFSPPRREANSSSILRTYRVCYHQAAMDAANCNYLGSWSFIGPLLNQRFASA